MNQTLNQTLNVSTLNIGDYLSETQYYKVVGKDWSNIQVQNERGLTFTIHREIAEEGIYSSIQYLEEKKVTKTEICEILQSAGNCIFSINFLKQLKEKDCISKLADFFKTNSNPAKKDITSFTKNLLKGQERTLKGYLIKSEPNMGRSTVIDLEVSPDKHRIRLIDHRTINWLILKNVKYIVK